MALTEMNYVEGVGGIAPLVVSVSSTYSGTSLDNLFDGDNSTRWSSGTETGEIDLFNTSQSEIKSISILVGDNSHQNDALSISLYGSNTSITDKTNQLYNASLKYNDGLTKILNTASHYKYYMISVAGSSAYYGAASELEIS